MPLQTAGGVHVSSPKLRQIAGDCVFHVSELLMEVRLSEAESCGYLPNI